MSRSCAKPATLSPTAGFFVSARQGDSEAMSNLFLRIHERLYRFSLYLTSDPTLAKDLCQDAYVKAITHIKSLDEDPKHFLSWLYKVTKNQFLDYVRSPRNQTKGLEESHGVQFPNNEILARIAEGLGSISAESRYLFLLVYLEDHSYAQAASLAGLTEEEVRRKLHQIRKSFRRHFVASVEPLKKG